MIKYNLRKLTKSSCELINQILPNEAELRLVKEVDKHIIESFNDAEKFVYFIGDIPAFDLRIKSIIYYFTHSDAYNEVKKKIKIVNDILDFFKSEVVSDWLKVVLSFGNYLNGTSNRGGALGFKLDTINKLNGIKSNDKKKTLLYFMVEWVIENKSELLNNLQLVENYDPNINIVVIQELLTDMKKSFLPVLKLKEFIPMICDPSDKTEEFLKSFYDIAAKNILDLENEIKALEEYSESVISFYGENPNEISFCKLIDIFYKFFKDIRV